MRKMIVYQCETCKKISTNAKEIYACEAAHLGLSVEEMDAWQQLLKEESMN